MVLFSDRRREYQGRRSGSKFPFRGRVSRVSRLASPYPKMNVRQQGRMSALEKTAGTGRAASAGDYLNRQEHRSLGMILQRPRLQCLL